MKTTTNTNTSNKAQTFDFTALAAGYSSDNEIRFSTNALFGVVASSVYWQKIQRCQQEGINDGNVAFIQANIDDFCEKPEYVNNRIQVSSLKAIRFAVGINTLLKRKGLKTCLNKIFKRNEEDLYNFNDAKYLCNIVASGYYNATKCDITDTRWELRA